MNYSVNQTLQMQQIPQKVVILTKIWKLPLLFVTLIEEEESLRVIWPTLMARSRLMMITLQLQRISRHQKRKEEPTIFLIVGGDMMEYTVVVKLKGTIQFWWLLWYPNIATIL